MKTRSTVLEGIKKINLIERDITPALDQILVKAHSASICLADVQMYRKGYYFYAKRNVKPDYPLFVGHEAGGTVVAVGSRVHEYREGDRVILMHSPRISGSITPGGMSDYWVAHPTDVVPVPEGMQPSPVKKGASHFAEVRYSDLNPRNPRFGSGNGSGEGGNGKDHNGCQPLRRPG